MSYTITDEQAENTRVAYSIMAGIPGERIHLDVVRDQSPSDAALLSPRCSSVACIAGFLSANHYFNERGLRWDGSFDGVICQAIGSHGLNTLTDASDFLFGNRYIFNGSMVPRLSHKSEALQRLRIHLLHAGRITLKRSNELAREEDAMS